MTAQLASPGARSLGLRDARDEVANRLALVWQSFDAGAALLGQAVVALAQDPALRRPSTMRAWLPRLMRERGAVLNTRRFARNEQRVGDEALRPGDVVVVGLREHAFGHGPHACPGREVALTLAATALETLLHEPAVAWPTHWQVLSLPNAQIPFFQESPR